MQYNGWTNRETWLVNLWFGDTLAMMQDDGDDITAEYIADMVTEYLNENLGEPRHGFIMDMMDLDAINYDELAAYYVTESADVE